MHKMIRATALLLCLILVVGLVFSDGSIRISAFAEETETAEAPVELWESPETAVSTEATEPSEESTEEPTEPSEDPTEPSEDPTEPTEPSEDPTEPTEPPEPPISEMTDEQIIAKYHIPNDWARAALIFAVRNGILSGKGNNNLAPRDNTTHAELATILISILKTEKMASLSKYTDIKSSSWYHDWMAKAVSLGIFPIADPNATKLTPNKHITREEAFVALARMFGVHGQGRQTIYSFSDWKDVSDWAAEDISAMIDAGCIAGSKGRILPKDKITRREFVQVLSHLLTKVGTEMESQDFTGQMGLGSDTVPANTTVNGDLLLSTDSTNLNLQGLTVTGRLILQGNDKVRLHLTNCSIAHLVLCRDAEIWSDNALQTVTSYKFLKLHCGAGTVNVYKTLIIADAGLTFDTVNAYYDCGITNQGTVNTLNVLGDSVYINGSGLIKTLNLKADDLTNYCAAENLVNVPHNNVNSITAVRTDSNKATRQNPNVKMVLKLQNMPEGWSECDLKWYVNTEFAGESSRNLLKEGSTISNTYDFSRFLDGFRTEVLFTVYITVAGKTRLLYRGYVNVEESVKEIAETVRTQNIQGKLRNNGTLYSKYDASTNTLSNAVKTVAADTQVSVLQSRNSTATRVRLQDGTVGWMSYYNVAIINDQYYVTSDYSTAVKEYYVNKVRKWGSNKQYMIWVSLYTQKINIFQGSKGNWTLIRSGPIASGRNDCPTPVEDTTLIYKTMRWNYPAPGHDPPFYCHHVTTFDSARGFHSRPTKWGEPEGSILYWAIGYPASAGCVRLLDEDCTFIYNNCPLGTAVHIY